MSKDLISIIEVCARSGVREIEIKDLAKISFHDSHIVFAEKPVQNATISTLSPDLGQDPEAEKDQVENLLIEDPAEYEALLAASMLEDDTESLDAQD